MLSLRMGCWKRDRDVMSNPLISVCIPTFNGRRFFRETIMNALSQESANFEIVICDDGSEDDLQDLVDEFNDPRIRYIHYQDNLGLAGNWNRTIEHARGEWIKFLFQDDLYASPRSLHAFEKESRENPDCKFIFSTCEQIDTFGSRTRTHRPFTGPRTFSPGDMIQILLFKGNQIGGPSNVFIKKELFSQTGLFDRRLLFALDLLMWIRMTARTSSRYIDSPLMKSRQHQDSATVKLSDEQVTFIDHYTMYDLLREDPLMDKDLLKKAKSHFRRVLGILIVRELLKTRQWPGHLIKQYKAISKMSR